MTHRSSVGLTIAEAGESAVIAGLTSRWRRLPELLVGPGDDAALISAPDSRVVATTDLLVEGRHFRRDWSSLHDVGRRAAAQNFADILAMGARPTSLLVGLAAPGETPLADLLAFADGLQEECTRAGASVAGGDLVRDDHLVVAITALGELDGRDPVLRSGASAGEVVVLCGRSGWSAAGLALLSAGHTTPPALVEAFRCPEPPYGQGTRLADAGATAMCDVSDGLLRDLGNLAEASGVRIELDLGQLTPDEPLRVAGELLARDPMRWVLTGGEDHGLVATLPSDVAPGFVRVIGRVLPAGDGPPVTAGGYEAAEPGWDSFRSVSGTPVSPA